MYSRAVIAQYEGGARNFRYIYGSRVRQLGGRQHSSSTDSRGGPQLQLSLLRARLLWVGDKVPEELSRG